jgi:oxidase EvaA
MLSTAEFHNWMAWRQESGSWRTTRIDFSQLDGWTIDAETENLRHHSGKFFTVEGLAVRTEGGPAASWAQPIIHQPEIGILGILVKRIDGILHCLMQAKMEPGNINQLQLSPTVQATRSNYMRVHNGSSIPYLDHFSGPGRGRVLVDVLQSEQGAWFNGKRNRNMVVEVDEDIPVLEDFCWLTVGQVRQLLATDDLVNMPARTVLSSMPLGGPTLASVASLMGGQSFGEAVAYSLSGLGQPQHSTRDLISWLNDAKMRNTMVKRNVPMAGLPGWHRSAAEISRDDERFFRVIAVSVDATTREVRRWTQPMVEPVGQGIAGFLAKRINGVVHVLVRASLEPGYLDAIEMAPTVHYLAGRYAGDDGTEEKPPYLSEFLTAQPSQVRFDAVQSEEGGRFYHARNRYMIVEVDPDYAPVAPPDYCWASVAQLDELVSHTRYLNVEARTLMACLNSLW